MSTNEERKPDTPIKTPKREKGGKPKVTVHPTPRPDQRVDAMVDPTSEQKPQSEEDAFMGYMNNLISNAVLDNESIKTKTVDVLKSLGQQLGLYMREVSRLKEEVEKLKKNSPEEKK